MEKKTAFNWSYLFIGILFILTSLVSFKNPGSSLITIIYVFSLSAICKGVFELFFRRKIHNYTSHKSTALIVLGIFDIFIGIFLVLNITTGLIALPFIFAIWFITDSFMSLISSDVFKLRGKGYYWFNVVLSIIGLITGVMLFFNPITSALTLSFLVGFYLMTMGILFIINSF